MSYLAEFQKYTPLAEDDQAHAIASGLFAIADAISRLADDHAAHGGRVKDALVEVSHSIDMAGSEFSENLR